VCLQDLTVQPLEQDPYADLLANFVLMDYGTGAVMAVPAMTSVISSLPQI
jgi:leucyl-tRNA synthetase